MGDIDLDPFSSAVANERVGAKKFYTQEDNGFEQEWHGKVWCNHPFSRENNPLIAPKMELEYNEGRMTQACLITFAATSERWFKPFLARPQCFIYKRLNYELPDGTVKKGVTKGSVITYYGKNVERFHHFFHDIGEIKIPYGYKAE